MTAHDSLRHASVPWICACTYRTLLFRAKEVSHVHGLLLVILIFKAASTRLLYFNNMNVLAL